MPSLFPTGERESILESRHGRQLLKLTAALYLFSLRPTEQDVMDRFASPDEIADAEDRRKLRDLLNDSTGENDAAAAVGRRTVVQCQSTPSTPWSEAQRAQFFALIKKENALPTHSVKSLQSGNAKVEHLSSLLSFAWGLDVIDGFLTVMSTTTRTAQRRLPCPPSRAAVVSANTNPSADASEGIVDLAAQPSSVSRLLSDSSSSSGEDSRLSQPHEMDDDDEVEEVDHHVDEQQQQDGEVPPTIEDNEANLVVAQQGNTTQDEVEPAVVVAAGARADRIGAAGSSASTAQSLSLPHIPRRATTMLQKQLFVRFADGPTRSFDSLRNNGQLKRYLHATFVAADLTRGDGVEAALRMVTQWYIAPLFREVFGLTEEVHHHQQRRVPSQATAGTSDNNNNNNTATTISTINVRAVGGVNPSEASRQSELINPAHATQAATAARQTCEVESIDRSNGSESGDVSNQQSEECANTSNLENAPTAQEEEIAEERDEEVEDASLWISRTAKALEELYKTVVKAARLQKEMAASNPAASNGAWITIDREWLATQNIVIGGGGHPTTAKTNAVGATSRPRTITLRPPLFPNIERVVMSLALMDLSHRLQWRVTGAGETQKSVVADGGRSTDGQNEQWTFSVRATYHIPQASPDRPLSTAVDTTAGTLRDDSLPRTHQKRLLRLMLDLCFLGQQQGGNNGGGKTRELLEREGGTCSACDVAWLYEVAKHGLRWVDINGSVSSVAAPLLSSTTAGDTGGGHGGTSSRPPPPSSWVLKNDKQLPLFRPFALCTPLVALQHQVSAIARDDGNNDDEAMTVDERRGAASLWRATTAANPFLVLPEHQWKKNSPPHSGGGAPAICEWSSLSVERLWRLALDETTVPFPSTDSGETRSVQVEWEALPTIVAPAQTEGKKGCWWCEVRRLLTSSTFLLRLNIVESAATTSEGAGDDDRRAARAAPTAASLSSISLRSVLRHAMEEDDAAHHNDAAGTPKLSSHKHSRRLYTGVVFTLSGEEAEGSRNGIDSSKLVPHDVPLEEEEPDEETTTAAPSAPSALLETVTSFPARAYEAELRKWACKNLNRILRKAREYAQDEIEEDNKRRPFPETCFLLMLLPRHTFCPPQQPIEQLTADHAEPVLVDEAMKKEAVKIRPDSPLIQSLFGGLPPPPPLTPSSLPQPSVVVEGAEGLTSHPQPAAPTTAAHNNETSSAWTPAPVPFVPFSNRPSAIRRFLHPFHSQTSVTVAGLVKRAPAGEGEALLPMIVDDDGYRKFSEEWSLYLHRGPLLALPELSSPPPSHGGGSRPVSTPDLTTTTLWEALVREYGAGTASIVVPDRLLPFVGHHLPTIHSNATTTTTTTATAAAPPSASLLFGRPFPWGEYVEPVLFCLSPSTADGFVHRFASHVVHRWGSVADALGERAWFFNGKRYNAQRPFPEGTSSLDRSLEQSGVLQRGSPLSLRRLMQRLKIAVNPLHKQQDRWEFLGDAVLDYVHAAGYLFPDRFVAGSGPSFVRQPPPPPPPSASSGIAAQFMRVTAADPAIQSLMVSPWVHRMHTRVRLSESASPQSFALFMEKHSGNQNLARKLPPWMRERMVIEHAKGGGPGAWSPTRLEALQVELERLHRLRRRQHNRWKQKTAAATFEGTSFRDSSDDRQKLLQKDDTLENNQYGDGDDDEDNKEEDDEEEEEQGSTTRLDHPTGGGGPSSPSFSSRPGFSTLVKVCGDTVEAMVAAVFLWLVLDENVPLSDALWILSAVVFSDWASI